MRIPTQNHSSILDLARQSCDGAESDYDPTGEFFPEDDGINWGEAEQDYDDELRYVNAGPQKLRKLAEELTDPAELLAVEIAQQAWNSLSPNCGIEAGYVDRGDEREAIHAQDLSECVSEVKASHYGAMPNRLEIGGIPKLDHSSTKGQLMGIIDVYALEAMGPPSSDEPMSELDLELMDI